MGEYQRWFKSLQDGDPVRVRKPWCDARVSGGLVVNGYVRKHEGTTGVTVYYRRNGKRLRYFMRYPTSPYTQLMPADGRVIFYDPKRGYVLPRRAAAEIGKKGGE